MDNYTGALWNYFVKIVAFSPQFTISNRNIAILVLLRPSNWWFSHLRDGCDSWNCLHPDGRRGTSPSWKWVEIYRHGRRQGISLALRDRLSARNNDIIYTTSWCIKINEKTIHFAPVGTLFRGKKGLIVEISDVCPDTPDQQSTYEIFRVYS